MESSHPFDCTMASSTRWYCSQLVTPANFGTLVDVNVTCLKWLGESRPPGVRRRRVQPSFRSNCRRATVSMKAFSSAEHLRTGQVQIVGVLIPAFRRRCVRSGKIGAVTPNLRRSTPEPPIFIVAPVTGLRGYEIIGRRRPCLCHLDLAPFGGSNRCRSSWLRAASLWVTAPRGFGCPHCSTSTSRGRRSSTSISSVVSTKSASCPTLPSPSE